MKLMNGGPVLLLLYLYPLLNYKIPSSPAQRISDDEFDEVKWEIEDEVVQPNYTSPAPSNALNRTKTPICIDSNQCSNLLAN